ncbi:hypothetical protein M758_5G085200 [Ceratodon purpureus]|nr:hypothetical protein M758_5G085200 [Ceratodon purpureus]
MASNHKLLVTSIDQVKSLASSATLDLNSNQCKYLSHGVQVTTKPFLREDFRTKIAEYSKYDTPRYSRLSKALVHLYSIVKRAENLMQRCCASKPGLTWQQRALTLFAMEDDVWDIIIHVRWWASILSMLVDVGGPSSKPSILERVREANQAFQPSLKDELQDAAKEDKQTLLNKVNTEMKDGDFGKKKFRNPDYLLLLQVKALLIGKDEDPTSQLNDFRHDGRYSLVGQGSFGVVHRVKWCGYGCVLKQYDGADDIEVKSMKRFHHPHIVRFFRHWRDEKCSKYKSHLLMERMEMDLEEHIKSALTKQKKLGKSEPFSDPVAIHIMLQVINAIWHMQSKGIVHRDLKPKNVLVRLSGKNVADELATEGYVEVKLGDFGIAKEDMETSHEGALTRNTGTTLYRAPELSSLDYIKVGVTKLPHQLDIWSFGIMCSQILTGKQPFEDAPLARYEGCPLPSDLKGYVDKNGRPSLPDHCPDYLRFCIQNCWELKPENRPKASDLWRMLRVAQLRSLGLIDQNYDFFSFTDLSNNFVELNPLRPRQNQGQNGQPSNKQALQRRNFRKSKSKGP